MQFKVRFKKTDQRLPIRFRNINRHFETDFKALQVVSVQPEFDYYEGDYEVTPSVDAQTLATRQKFMTDDVRIKEIPYFDVSNNSGGSTVYIGTLEELIETTAVLGTARLNYMIL